MEFRTVVDIPKPSFQIETCEEVLFVGSCFADNIGQRFKDDKFRATVNPFGVMYNPASVFHTIQRITDVPRVVFLTLGTNHIYRLKETGEIVDNCEKRPQRLFQEEELTVEECVDYLRQVVELLKERNSDVQVVLTVSPIRYQKYGFHGSQLSKATLLLAIKELQRQLSLFNSQFLTSLPTRLSMMNYVTIVSMLLTCCIHHNRQWIISGSVFPKPISVMQQSNSLPNGIPSNRLLIINLFIPIRKNTRHLWIKLC